MQNTVEDMSTLPKENIALSFAKAFLYVFVYAGLGLKFLCFDIWSMLFNRASFNVDKAYKKIAPENIMEESEALYEKTKNNRKAQRANVVIKHSEKEMAKYLKMKEALNSDLQTSGAIRSKTPVMYQYVAMEIKTGKIITDTISGFSKLDVNSFLVNDGYEVYSIKTSTLINFLYQDSGSLGGKMSQKDLVFWLTQLYTYLKAGITLNESVKILTVQMANKKSVAKILKRVSYELVLGESFSQALAKQGNYFPPLLINMIKAAEAAGTLEETLKDMADYYNDIEATRKEMISALTYPAIITVFALAVVTFIILYVVPQFTQLYTDSNIEINGFTKFVIDFSAFLKSYWLMVILVIVGVLLAIIYSYKKIKAFKISCQILTMHIPVIKNVIIYNELTIFSKTFASLLKNNVYITESMGILGKLTNNEIYKSIIYKTVSNIIKGEKISDAFKDHWAIPDVAYYMIVTGESTGQLGEMMEKVSVYYQQEHKNIVSSLKSLIEPIMIIFLAVIVCAILLAVMVPMFSMYDQMI